MDNIAEALKELHDMKNYIEAVNELGPSQNSIDKMSDRQLEALRTIAQYHENLMVKIERRIKELEHQLVCAKDEYVRLCEEEKDESNDNSNGQ